MFQVRKHISQVSPHHKEDMVEITATGENIPITENWENRWCIFPQTFADYYGRIRDFPIRTDDVFVATTPKSGTTLMQEACWLLLNNLNYAVAKDVDLSKRSPFLEMNGFHKDLPDDRLELANNMESPRLIKSHLPTHLLPIDIWKHKTKFTNLTEFTSNSRELIIYCTRSLKDVIVSYYNFLKGLGAWNGNIDEFIDDFTAHEISYAPHWPSVIDFWRMRKETNIFFTTYEQMLQDQRKVLRELCEFLERPTLTEAELDELVTHLSFDNMKANARTNPTKNLKNLKNVQPNFEFMRRGVAGAFKDELSLENQQRLDQYSINCLKEMQFTPEEILEIMSLMG